MDNSLYFVARIAIKIRAPGKPDIVWSGHWQRVHDVTPGEWIQTGNASIAFLNAFNTVLADC